jgi:iron complex outermembrane receptor protein
MFHCPARSRSKRHRIAAAVAASLVGMASAQAQPQHLASVQLGDLSLEQLREVVVWTVGRQREHLGTAAAAVYVISADDIRRSGATTLPEALRLAPMLDVARADANQYAISTRGFNNVLANKLLVLIDGRTVYSPLFSGVFWEAQDVLLEDVERIEVVSGPATALWGTNAVNGLINIITREAGATGGASIGASLGHRERVGSARLGWRLGESTSARVYAKTYDRDDTSRADGSSVNDQADGRLIGLRADWKRPDANLLLQAEDSEGTIDSAPAARRFTGSHLLLRWQQDLGERRSWTFQGYIEQTTRHHPGTFHERLRTGDALAEYQFAPLPGHQLLLGAGARTARDEVTPFPALAFIPGNRRLSWTRLYLRDQFEASQTLSVTAALSAERNPYTGTELLPNLRLGWQVRPDNLLWVAWSRAVRAPSRTDREFHQPGQPPYLIAGGPQFDSEVSSVIETGWRSQPTDTWSFDLGLFHHEHRGLRSLARTPAGLQFRNDIDGRTSGMRGWTRWRAQPGWRIDAGFVALRQSLRVRTGATDFGGLAVLGNDPRHWLSLRSSLDLGARWAWDVSVRRVGARPQPAVPAYTAIDSRLAWSTGNEWELALVLRNIGDPRHPEWGAPANRVEHQRSALLQLQWRH